MQQSIWAYDKKTRRGTCHQCNALHGPCFFGYPSRPEKVPIHYYPAQKMTTACTCQLFSITKKQNLRKPYHKPTTPPKMNIAPAKVSPPQKEMIGSSNRWAQNHVQKS